MTSFFTYLHKLNKVKVGIIFLSLCFLVSVAVFILPQLRQAARIKLGSVDGLTITADKQDSLGIFTNTQFTVKTDTDLSPTDLKKNLTIFPATDFDVQPISARQFTLIPKQNLLDNSIYRIEVKTNQKTFSWAFQTKNEFRVVSTLPADKSVYVPTNTGIELIFSHENWEDPKSFFTISPKTEISFERHGRTASFLPKSLNPGTIYTVTLKKGLNLKGTVDTLKDDFTFQFETKPSTPIESKVSFSKPTYEFSDTVTPAFDVYVPSESLSAISADIYKYPSDSSFLNHLNIKNSTPSWASYSISSENLPTNNLAKVNTLNLNIQKQKYSNFFSLPQTLPIGQYLIEVSAAGQKSQALFQVTNVSAYFTQSGTKTLIWVNSLANTPLSGATVSYNNNNQTTDQNGIAYFETDPSDIQLGFQNKTTIVAVKHSLGALYFPLKSEYSIFYQKQLRQSDKYWSYVYIDRPTYLPTDTVRLWGLIKNRDLPDKKTEFTLEVTRTDYHSWDYQPIAVYSKKVTTTDLGTYLEEINLNNFSPGWYSLSFKVDGETVINSGFSVETYIKPAYKISVQTSTKAAFSGDQINLSGQVQFFEGTPVVGMPLKSYNSDNSLASLNVATDSQGKFSVSVPVKNDSANYSPSSVGFTFSPKNPEEGQITGSASVAVFSSSLYFPYPLVINKNNQTTVTINLRQVDLQKYSSTADLAEVFNPAPNQNVHAVIYQIDWLKNQVGTYYDFINKVTSPSYEYSQSMKQIGELDLVTNSFGQAVYNTNLPENSTYKISFTAKDSQGRSVAQDAYLYSNHFSNVEDNYLHLKTDKNQDESNKYNIGDQVNLHIEQAGKTLADNESDKFLFIVSQRGIRSYYLTDNGQFSFKYPESFIPNFYVQAIRFNGQTYQSTENLSLFFNQESKKLNLKLTSDKSQYQPADTAKINVTTLDNNNNPVPAEVVLNVVDESYYALFTDYLNPLSEIYKSVNTDIIATYSSHQYPSSKSGAEGGGCFLPGTQILMADGKSKDIEEIKPGDNIKTRQSFTNKKLVSAKVKEVFTHQVSGYLLINNHLRVTKEHNLYVNGRWLTAGEVKIGDSYLSVDGTYQTIKSVEQRSGLYTVYNLSVDNLHTFFAEGFYVHNEKGGSLFKDTAFFGTLTTNNQGQGSIDIKLPDNLTSWRVSSVGLSSNLQTGSKTFPLLVRLPFFLTATLNTDYLVSDKPIIIVRAFGDGLVSGDQVNFKVESSTLNFSKSVTGQSFEPVKIDVDTLKEGQHKLIFTATSSKGSYKLERTINVLSTHLSRRFAKSFPLTENVSPSSFSAQNQNITIAERGLGKYYPQLLSLVSTWGDRLDQKNARALSQELLNQYFQDQKPVEKIDFNLYQTNTGGFSLFPYSSAEVENTAFLVALSKNKIDNSAAKNYLYSALTEAKDLSAASKALFGIASLGEPVLIQINNIIEDPKTDLESKLYLGLSLAKIGDKERAVSLYRELLSSTKLEEQNISVVALLADLSAMLNQPEADDLLNRVFTTSTKEYLLVNQKLLALQYLLPQANTEPVSFTYSLAGTEKKISLAKGKNLNLYVTEKDLPSLKFSNISGQAIITSVVAVPVEPAKMLANSSLVLTRTFYVAGKESTSIKESDLVKVGLTFQINDNLQDGCYQVQDVLPSGLVPVSALLYPGQDTNLYYYPYQIDGQKVSFCVSKNSTNKNIYYYARVVNPGVFKAENALIQSLANPSIFTLSPSSEINIK